MKTLVMILLFVFFLSLMFMKIALTLGKKSNLARDKLTTFECGFDPIKKARTPFSLRFFLLTIMFLIFDVEIVVILPLALAKCLVPSLPLVTGSIIVIFILIFGLLYEWDQSSIDWL